MNRTELWIGSPIFINPAYQQLKARWIRPYLHISPQLPEHKLNNALQKLNEWTWKKKLAATLKNVDLIHLHFGGFASKQFTWLQPYGKPFIISLYGYDYLKLPMEQIKIGQQYPQMFEQASGILVEGPHGKKIMTEHWNVPAEKVFITPLGVALPDTKPEVSWKKPDHFRWLQVAHFKEKKGQEYSIRAFEKLLQERPEDILTFVGNGPGKDYCIQLTQQLGISHAVQFFDSIPHAQLRNFMKDFDVFIHPSFQTSDGDTEGGAPVILLEAQSIGLPVISTFHADIPYIVSDGNTGFLAPEKSTIELVVLMRRMTETSESELIKMKSNAINWVYDRFNARSCAENIQYIYEQVLQKN